MLKYFGYKNWHDKIINAFETLLQQKNVLTPDLGGKAATVDIGDEICRLIKNT